MEIISLYINGYKKFYDFDICFGSIDESTQKSNRGLLGSENLNIAFLIGENGSGKSSFLEALSIIFSRVMINQKVSFEFNLVYKIFKNKRETIVKLKNKKELNKYSFSYYLYNNAREWDKGNEDYGSRTDLHPNKIITIASGPHNNFEELLIDLPVQKLQEEIVNTFDSKSEESIRTINLYEDVLFNPKNLNLDIDSLIYVFISLMFFGPNFQKIDSKIIALELEKDEMTEDEIFEQEQRIKEEKRNILDGYMESISILKKNVNEFEENGFSLKIDTERMKEFEEQINNESNIGEFPKKFLDIFLKFLEKSNPALISDKNGECTFYFNKKKMNKLQEDYLDNELNGLNILTTFMIANRLKIIKNATAYVKYGKTKDDLLMTHETFSDGEWYWLCKMGVIILTENGSEDNFLTLLDEPDVFLNEGWIEDFILNLNNFADSLISKENKRYNDYIVATHSTLMLTDALQSQVFKFEKDIQLNKIFSKNITFSPFGADRNLISSKLFLNDKRTGSFVESKIKRVFKIRENKDIDNLLSHLGQGYDRFLVHELKLELDSENK